MGLWEAPLKQRYKSPFTPKLGALFEHVQNLNLNKRKAKKNKQHKPPPTKQPKNPQQTTEKPSYVLAAPSQPSVRSLYCFCVWSDRKLQESICADKVEVTYANTKQKIPL